MTICHRVSSLDNLWHRPEVGPVQLILVLPIIEAMSEPYTPYYVVVGSGSSHKMPNAVSFCRLKDTCNTHHQP
jgi:hypothetical protein